MTIFHKPFHFRRVSLILMVAMVWCGAVCSATAQTTAEPYNWRNVEIVGGGFVPGILFHPTKRDLIYARTDIGGIYRWNPAAKRWISLSDSFNGKDWNLYGGESIAIDPTDPNRLYMAAGTYTNSWAGNGAILRSNDQGNTWQRTDLSFKLGGNEDGRSIGERLMVDPNSPNILYFGSRHDGLWKSIDYAATWKKVTTFPDSEKPNPVGVGFVCFDKTSGKARSVSQTIYAGTADRLPLYRSTDGGTTWKPVANQPTGFIPHHAVLTSSGTLYLTYSDGPGPNGIGDGAVWKMDTHSDRWTEITPVKPKTGGWGNFGYAGLSVDAAHPDTLVVSTMDKWSTGDDIYRTTDAGKTWKPLKAHAQMNSQLSPFLNWAGKTANFGHWMGAVEIDPFDPNRALYGTGATIWGSDDLQSADSDHPTHWNVWAQGLEETAVLDLISPPSGVSLISGLGDIGGFTHSDLNVSPIGGMTINPLLNGNTSLDFAETTPNSVVRVGSGGNNRTAHGAISTDGGKNWTPFATEPKNGRGAGHIAISADGKTIVWTPNNTVANFSTDNGATWTICGGLPVGVSATVIADRADPKIFYAIDDKNHQLFVSKDGGAGFTAVGAKLPGNVNRLRAVPNQMGDLWMACGESGLWHSTDGGTTWTKSANVTDANTMGLGKAAPGKTHPTLFLIGAIRNSGGIFRSDDVGHTWRRISDSRHEFGTANTIIGDPRLYGRVYVGTNGRGILYADPVGVRAVGK